MSRKIVYIQINNYLISNNLLTSCEFGFRPKLYTENVSEDIYSAYSQRKYAVCVFMDLTKAFDTISHSILLWKHQYHGINGSAQNGSKVIF